MWPVESTYTNVTYIQYTVGARIDSQVMKKALVKPKGESDKLNCIDIIIQ